MVNKYLLICIGLLCCANIYAQEVKIYGSTGAKGKPMPGVLIVIFEGDSFCKKMLTDKNGKYKFRADGITYNIFFYKPGYKPQQARVINQLNAHTQSIPIDMDMESSDEPPDSLLAHAGILDRMDAGMAGSYIAYIYEYERKHPGRSDDTSHSTKNVLLKRALDEQKRFANYKQKATERDDNDGRSKVIFTTIGPDHYEMVISAKGDKRYYKNEKPVTQATYLFETKRRYDSILKNKRDVKRFEKYDPMKKVKKK